MRIGVATLLAALIAVVLLTDDAKVQVGLIGLIGTLIGAFATFEAAELTGRRESRARERSAGRLLQEELRFARDRCQYARDNGSFWAPRLDLVLDSWERYAEDASQAIDRAQDWRKVADAFHAMRAVQSKCNALRAKNGDRPELGPLSEELIGEYLMCSDAALDVLSKLSGDRPTEQRPREDEKA